MHALILQIYKVIDEIKICFTIGDHFRLELIAELVQNLDSKNDFANWKFTTKRLRNSHQK